MQSDVVVEIPKGSRVKYEINDGRLVVDRILHTPLVYFFNYGYIEKTLGGDGDPLDAVVLCDEAFHPCCIVSCRPVAVILTEDEKGRDEKIVLVPVNDPTMAEIKDLHDIPKNTVDRLVIFFEQYKSIEDSKWSKVLGIKGNTEAERIIQEATRAA